MKRLLYQDRKGQVAKQKKLAKAALAGFCSLAIIMTSFNPALPAATVYAAVDTKLNNLVIDKVYELHPTGELPEGSKVGSNGFSPEITQYNGIAYSSVDEIKIYPFAASSTAIVKVNNVALNGGYATINVKAPGVYPVTIKVSEGGQETSYHVTITKVDTDYRGRKAIVKNDKIMEKLSVKTDAGDQAKLLEILKKDYLVHISEIRKPNQYVDTKESYWETYAPPADESGSTKATSFTVDLGDVYSISRIRAVVGPAKLRLKDNVVRISVSTDGENWEVPIAQGNINTNHQDVIRYEFGVSHQVRFIKYEITKWQHKDMNLRLYQFMIYYDAGTVPEEQPAPDGGSVPYQQEERHQYLANGQATVIERGLPLSGWTPSDGYGRGIPTREEARQFGYDGPLFYDPDFGNKDYMLYNPDALWGIAKAPFGGNTMASAGEPRDFITESMKPYINNAISFCFGDEGKYSTKEAESFKKWFQWTKERYPGVILHSNQGGNQWSEAQLREFIKIAKPDMLSWDNYYGDTSPTYNLSKESVQRSADRRLMTLSNWEIYRKLAYGGVDGSGSKPILFGQYLDTFETNLAESAKNLETNLSILSGAKWLNFFRLEYQFDRCYLWDEDGTPTRGLLEWKQIIDRIHAVDDQTNRLNNDWIMFKLGSIGNDGISPDGFRRGNFDSSKSAEKNAEFGIKDISVKSLSKAFDGGTGDVVLGYFNTIPGLYEDEIAEYFKGATAPKAFMVMNGLIAGKSESYNRFNIPERDLGSSENTRQEITVKTSPEFADKTLYYVDKDDRDSNGNGVIKEVKRDTDGNFTLILGGGESNLYFWATNTTAKASSQSEGAYASFAFDGHPDTYWEPSSPAADHTYTVEKTFAPRPVNQVMIQERGNAVRGYQVEYLTADDQWLPFGEAGKTLGAAAQVRIGQAVKACGIRLRITDAAGVPAIYGISCSGDIIPYYIEIGKLVNGMVVTNPPNKAIYHQTVKVTVSPDAGYRLKKGSLKAVLEQGGTLALDETGNPAERTFSMPAQKVTLQASFEKIPIYTVTVDTSMKNGNVKFEKSKVEAGGEDTISFIPDAGYTLGTLFLNHEPWYVPKGDLVLKNIDCDMTISPNFVTDDHTFHTVSVITDSKTGGSVEPAEQRVLDEGNAVLIAHPNTGYHARSVTVKTTAKSQDFMDIASGSNAQRDSNTQKNELASKSDIQRYEIASGSDAQRYEIASGSNAQEREGRSNDVIEGIKGISKDYLFQDGSDKIVIPYLTADSIMSVTFEQIMNPISVEKANHGILTVDLKKAGYGQIVTVKVAADEGYRLKADSLKVVTDKGEQQNLKETEAGKVYTFKMPLSKVSISTQFEADSNPPITPEKPNPSVTPQKPQRPDYSSDEGTPVYTSTPGWNFDHKGWRYRKNGVYAFSSWEYLDWNGQPGWYYFGPDEYMVSGWFLDQTGNWYYLNPVSDGSKGRMKTGWLLDTDGHWYYLNPVSDGFMGKMSLGWQEIQGKWYYFNDTSNGTKGALLVNTITPDGVQVGSDGAKRIKK